MELAAGVDNPLPGIAEARQVQATGAEWAGGAAPAPAPFEVVGTYRLFG